jgi:hypothetical protein
MSSGEEEEEEEEIQEQPMLTLQPPSTSTYAVPAGHFAAGKTGPPAAGSLPTRSSAAPGSAPGSAAAGWGDEVHSNLGALVLQVATVEEFSTDEGSDSDA